MCGGLKEWSVGFVKDHAEPDHGGSQSGRLGGLVYHKVKRKGRWVLRLQKSELATTSNAGLLTHADSAKQSIEKRFVRTEEVTGILLNSVIDRFIARAPMGVAIRGTLEYAFAPGPLDE